MPPLELDLGSPALVPAAASSAFAQSARANAGPTGWGVASPRLRVSVAQWKRAPAPRVGWGAPPARPAALPAQALPACSLRALPARIAPEVELPGVARRLGSDARSSRTALSSMPPAALALVPVGRGWRAVYRGRQ